MRGFLVVLAAFVVVGVYATTPRSQAHLNYVPQANFTKNYDQYSGYVTLKNTTKNIFYWFFTSQNNPSTDPFVLWLQGGPGCSDLGGGLFEENGPYLPFILDAKTKEVGLNPNFYSWNTVANVLYIDSPCGVGFSYGGSPSDYHNTDNGTAIDTFVFLQGFFEIYPEFKSNQFWITGESYAGIYIPTLAYQILTNTTSSSAFLKTNLEKGGLMLGNPVTGCDGSAYGGEDDINFLNTKVYMFYWHAMISRNNYDQWNNMSCNTPNPPSFAKCFDLYLQIEKGIGHFDQPLFKKAEQMHKRITEEEKQKRLQMLFEDDHRAPPHRPLPNMPTANEWPSGSINPDCLYYSFCQGNATLQFNTLLFPDCFNVDNQVSAYLNHPATQKAINAKPKFWRACGGVEYQSDVGSILPYLNFFFSNAPTMRILYYSGDIDIDTVPFGNTQRCLAQLFRPVVDAWRPYVINKEVAGYVEIYDTYQYATIKGAGHEAPAYQPYAAYVMFTSFLKNQTFPKD